MALKIIGDSGYESDSSTDKALYVESRPPSLSGHGSYIMALNTSFITATLGAGQDLFSLWWNSPNSICLMRYISITGMVTSTITTGVKLAIGTYFARSFTAHDTGGVGLRAPETGGPGGTTGDGYVFSPDNAKLWRVFPASLMGDARCAYTVGLTAGTYVLDANPLSIISSWTGTAVANNIFKYAGFVPLIDRTGYGQYPVVLAQNEGIVVQSFAAGPATGSFKLEIMVEWQEAYSY